MFRRPFALAIVCAIALSACGSARLDRQQQEAEARACASLIERGTTRRKGPVEVAGETVDLRSDPEGFYDVLEEKRSADFFAVDDPKDKAKTQNARISDSCKVSSASTSSP